MPRISGNKVPLLTLKVGAASAVDFGTEVVSIEFTDGDGGAVTMADYAQGVAPVQMNVTFVLDFSAASSYEYLWTNAGTSGVTYTVQFQTGAASQTNPKFSGTLTMPPKPRFTVEAGDATEVVTYDASFALDTWTKSIA